MPQILIGALEDTSGSLLWVGVLILIWEWLCVFDTSKFLGLDLYLDLEDAKNICPLSPILGLWRKLKVPP